MVIMDQSSGSANETPNPYNMTHNNSNSKKQVSKYKNTQGAPQNFSQVIKTNVVKNSSSIYSKQGQPKGFDLSH